MEPNRNSETSASTKNGADVIHIGGGDTATPLNLLKRISFLELEIGLRNRRVLDAGCGAGEYVEAFVAHGADAVGVEYNMDKVAAYRRHHPGSDRVSQGNLDAVPFADRCFDLVVLNEVLEHTQTKSVRWQKCGACCIRTACWRSLLRTDCILLKPTA